MRELIPSALDVAAACAAHGATSTGYFRFADLCVHVTIVATQRADHLLRMVEHRRIAPPESSTCEITVIEGWHGRLACLLPPPDCRDKRLFEVTEDSYYCWTPELGGNLTALDRGSQRALMWYPAAGEIASWEFSRPVLSAIHAFTLPTSWTPVHAAAIARNGCAILVAGRGGVGKTTTALACAEAGWDYLSDDFVLVDGRSRRASSLYRSARMRADMFARMPRSMAAVTAVSTDDGEVRAEVDVGSVGRVSSSTVEIQAIVVPRRAGAAHGAVVSLRRSEALTALTAPTLTVLAGGQKEIFAKLADLVESVPCYSFEPGPWLADIPETLAALVKS